MTNTNSMNYYGILIDFIDVVAEIDHIYVTFKIYDRDEYDSDNVYINKEKLYKHLKGYPRHDTTQSVQIVFTQDMDMIVTYKFDHSAYYLGDYDYRAMAEIRLQRACRTYTQEMQEITQFGQGIVLIV